MTNNTERMKILGVPVDMVKAAEALEIFKGLMGQSGCSLIVTPNSEIVVNATSDPELLSLIESAELVIPDGIGLVYASRILKKPLTERVTGIDFLSDILGYLEATGGSVYLLGGKPGIGEQAAVNIKGQHPGLKVEGVHHGYFDSGGEGGVVEDINASGAEFLCVAMGSPKQEKFIDGHREEFLHIRAAMGVGGSLDVWAGTLARAPGFFRKHGFEWLYRLYQEPKRFKRVLKLPVFIIKVMFSKK